MVQNRIKIILVEDNEADAVLIERQITKIIAFPKLIQVSDLEEFKSLTKEFKPDLILSDYQLNGFTGFEVLEHVNSLPRHIPIIFITGTINNEELAANTILTGAAGYILKKKHQYPSRKITSLPDPHPYRKRRLKHFDGAAIGSR